MELITEDDHINMELLTKYADLYSHMPTNMKGWKDRNFSPQMYQALTRTNGYNIKPSTRQEREGVKSLLDIVWTKIEERFSMIKSAFRYFDTDNSGTISYNEFCFGMQNLGCKMTDEQFRRVFKYVDKNNDGGLTFNEFR